jgi:hypothetical protein
LQKLERKNFLTEKPFERLEVISKIQKSDFLNGRSFTGSSLNSKASFKMMKP